MYQPNTPPLPVSDQDMMIFQTALELIDGGGLSAVTIREISRRCGMTASGFLYHFGSRDSFLITFFQRLSEKENLYWADQNRRFSQTVSTGNIAHLTRAIILDRVMHHADRIRAMWSFQLETRNDANMRDVLKAWRQSDILFWRTCAGALGLTPDLAPGIAGLALATSRLIILSENHIDSVLWADDIITRFWERVLRNPVSVSGDSSWRASAAENLDPISLKGGASSTPDRIVQAASELILEKGCAALSHRAIARRAGVSLSSTTHHFQTLNDILLAAFDAIYAKARSEVTDRPQSDARYSKRDFIEIVMPSLSGRRKDAGTSAFAMEDIILTASRHNGTDGIATALFALYGQTMTQLISGIEDAEITPDRLDGHVLRVLISGILCGHEANAMTNNNIGLDAALNAYL